MKKYSLLLFLALAFNACVNDEEFNKKVEDLLLPRVLNGRLYFETPQAYLQFIGNTIV
ncbi:MAG TPA: hypothetical protein PLV21_00580 [Cyclobacteriaceae bacterium]|nr:hypothetical protein [Cyclobacteriaceae bacterium]HRJ80347.1 hypothetical protein [Cyclobacteriaceae bacterium]